MTEKGTLTLLCGKMAAGKSTFAHVRAKETHALVISEDDWLAAHYPDQINNLQDYLTFSRLIKPFLKSHVQAILAVGTNVILDFPANTRKQRQWLLGIATEIEAEHALFYLNVSNELCLQQLSQRRTEQPERVQFDKPEVFHELNKYFEAPSDSEGLTVIERKREQDS